MSLEIGLPSKVFSPFGALKSSWSAPTVIHVKTYLALSVARFSTPVSKMDCKIPRAPACIAKPHSVTKLIQMVMLCYVGVAKSYMKEGSVTQLATHVRYRRDLEGEQYPTE